MKKASTYRQLTINQRRFVEERGAAFDASDWTTDYEANLFARLHSDTVADLTVAKGLAADGTGGASGHTLVNRARGQYVRLAATEMERRASGETWRNLSRQQARSRPSKHSRNVTGFSERPTNCS